MWRGNLRCANFPPLIPLNQIGGLFEDIYIDNYSESMSCLQQQPQGRSRVLEENGISLNFFPPFLPCKICNLLVKANLTLFIQTVYFLS